jgi:hypothetical protein
LARRSTGEPSKLAAISRIFVAAGKVLFSATVNCIVAKRKITLLDCLEV